MATYYWVGGAGTWDATTTTNWAASSGGSGSAGVPTSADNVIFDTLSNATAYAVTIGTDAVCLDVTIAGPAVGNVTITSSATSVINVFGSWTNAATGVAFTTANGAGISFSANTTGKTITTNNVDGYQIIIKDINGIKVAEANYANGEGECDLLTMKDDKRRRVTIPKADVYSVVKDVVSKLSYLLYL